MSTVRAFKDLPEVDLTPDGAEIAVADRNNGRTVRMQASRFGDGGGADQIARDAAAAAQTTANENRAEITAEETARRAADNALREELAHAAESIGRIDVNPGRIDKASDLDGDYQCIISLTEEEVTRLTARGANFLEIWFGDEAVHELSPWAPALATRVDVTIDTTEESQIGAVGNALPVRAIYRRAAEGAELYLAEAPGALRVGGYAPDDGGTDQTARDAAAKAQATADENRVEIMSEASTRRDMDGALGKRITDTAKQALGRVEVNPGRIEVAEDLDGTYQCIVKLTDQEVEILKAAGVNYLEIWFGVEAIHEVSPWTPALTTRVDAVIDAREETQIGAVGNVLPVRAIYRINQGGGQAYYAEAIGALQVGGKNEASENRRQSPGLALHEYRLGDFTLVAYNEGDYNASRIVKGGIMVTPQLGNGNHGILLGIGDLQDPLHQYVDEAAVDGRTAVMPFFARETGGSSAFTGNFASRRASGVGGNVRFEVSSYSTQTTLATGDSLTLTFASLIRAEFTGLNNAIKANATAAREAAEAAKEAQTAAETAALTLAQQIGLVQFAIGPGVLGNRGVLDFQRTFRLRVSGGDKITDDAWYDVIAQGQEVLARRKWDPDAIPNLVVKQAIATAISNNLAAGDAAAEFQVRFYSDSDGTNLVEIVNLYVSVPTDVPRIQAPAFANPLNIDASNGGIADVTLTGNTVIGVTGGVDGSTLLVRLLQDATGGRTATLASAITAYSAAPELASGAGKRTLLLFHRIGTTWAYLGQRMEQ